MQSAVLARPFLSVRLSVRISFIAILAGITPSEGVKVKRPPVASEFDI